jgi:aminoglycoside phosphotransferase (APT) family kinase protein
MEVHADSARPAPADIVRGRVIPTGRLARAVALAPRIALLDPESPLRSARRVVVSAARLTSTDVAVVVLARSGEAPSAVVKLPMNAKAAARLEVEMATLQALHADNRLGRWRELVPRPLASGTLRGQRYRVESALAGHSAAECSGPLQARRGALRMTADMIAVLHRITAVSVRGDPALAGRWIDEHLEELEPYLGRDRRLCLAAARLSHELHAVLEGGSYTASRIHGDYWLGNVLFAGPEPGPGALAGIVDWDASSPCELPLHDLLHLLMYTRRLLTGRELGVIVSEQLRRGEWPVEEHLLFDRCALWSEIGALSPRQALLLYWLRHAAMHTRQQSEPGGWRFRLWHRRNVLPVLESL